MEYKKYGADFYIRLDKGDEVTESLLNICKKENILSAVFSGIGGFKEAVVSTYLPDKKEFLPHSKTGLLELVSMNGNIISDEENNIYEHTHAMFSYYENDEVKFIGGHLKKAVVLLTAEIKLEPVENETIKRKFNPEAGIPIWDFD